MQRPRGTLVENDQQNGQDDGRDVTPTGKVRVWDPPRHLEYEWNVESVPEMPRGEQAIFRYELTPEGDSTHLVVT